MKYLLISFICVFCSCAGFNKFMLDQAFLHEDVRLIAGKYHVWVHSDWIECDYFLEKPKEQREHIEQYYCEMCERHIQRVQEIMNEK